MFDYQELQNIEIYHLSVSKPDTTLPCTPPGAKFLSLIIDELFSKTELVDCLKTSIHSATAELCQV